jgi:hypothetical protein
MTPSPSRAAERKEKRTNAQGAAIPAPLPQKPEPTQPVLPLPDVQPAPAELPSPPENPPPTTSRYDGVVMAGESRQEFDAFCEHLHDYYMPYNAEEQVFVGKLAESRWFLRRRKRVFETVEAGLYAVQPDPTKWSEADFKRLALADSYRAQAERAVNGAHKHVEAFMRQRTDDYHFHAHRDLALDRFQLQVKKYEFSLWKAGLRPRSASQSDEPEPSTKTAKVS